MSFTDAEHRYLLQTRLGRIATASGLGEPDVAAVAFTLLDDDRIAISGMDNTRTRKYHNVKANARASFVIDDLASVEPWQARGVKVTGSATIGTDSQGKPTLELSAETIWSWGINTDADTYFGPIEKRTA